MAIDNLAGQTLGQYELHELLGAGGMGAVYRAYQVTLKREVAIKILPTSLATQPGYVERFNREAETAASLEHAHIVPIYDYGMQRGTTYIVMRMLTGGSLAQRLAQRAEENRPWPSLGEISELLNEIGSALDYAHNQGVIHRDIKPANIMFDNQGNAYLADFGIAKLLDATSNFTETGHSVGTPSYMAPEQWRADTVLPATDQYALGVMTYMLVAGRLPFEASTPYALMNKHVNESATPPTAWKPDLPPALGIVLERAMAKDPADRFPNVTAFAQAFGRAIQGSTGESTNIFRAPIKKRGIQAKAGDPLSTIHLGSPRTGGPASRAIAAPPPERSSSRGVSIIALVIVLAVILIGGGAAFVASRQPSGSPTTAGVVLLSTVTPTPEPTSLTTVPNNTTVAPPTTAVVVVVQVTSTPEQPTLTHLPVAAQLPSTQSATNSVSAATTIAPAATTQPPPTSAATTVDSTQAVASGIKATDTALPTIALLPSATPAATLTSSIAPSATLTLSVTPSATATLSLTPSNSPQPSLTDTATVSAADQALTLKAIQATQTATLWTDTPTPDMRASLVANLTFLAATDVARSHVNQTGTAASAPVTPTVTKTSAPTATLPPTITLTPTTMPVQAVTINAQWTPQVSTFNGVPMMLVPTGCYMMGVTGADIAAMNALYKVNYFGDETPQTKICFTKPFWIDEYPVYQSQWLTLAGKPPAPWVMPGEMLPVEQTTWADAENYCTTKRGGRLPTEAEWEYVARGPDDLAFPWGKTFDANKAVFAGNSSNHTAAVNRTDRVAVSWVGAVDMSGNVHEWTGSLYGAYPYNKDDGREVPSQDPKAKYVIRGGSWSNPEFVLRSTFRAAILASYNDGTIGFRCLRAV